MGKIRSGKSFSKISSQTPIAAGHWKENSFSERRNNLKIRLAAGRKPMRLPRLKTTLVALAALVGAGAVPAVAQDVKPLIFWERSGGNDTFVRILIEAW